MGNADFPPLQPMSKEEAEALHRMFGDGGFYTGFKAEDDLPIRRILVSVAEKEGVVEFINTFKPFIPEVISTGGTFDRLTAGGIDAWPLERVARTGQMLGDRVKTLQVDIAAPVLADKTDKEHMKDLYRLRLESKRDIRPIDLIVVNLYKFEEFLAGLQAKMEKEGRAELTEEERKKLTSLIDIGGPTL